ncbi:sulfite exporter TauE/SafE family protein [Spiroplasma endosymbiont of Atherix ibis]|uniref:sulfite exporter TauE/SafE family protein n=1 Tax=Spiroplasma endosymbiont of Atherix ibis TaxID=3066291 RepID=UPI0030CA79FD
MKKLISKEEYLKIKSKLKEIVKKYNTKVNTILDYAYSLSLDAYNKGNELRDKINYTELKKEYKDEIEKIKTEAISDSEKKQKIKLVKNNYAIYKKSISSKVIKLIGIIMIPLFLFSALLLNYLYYFKKANNGKEFDLKDLDHMIAFITVIIGCILILGFLAFMSIFTIKRLFLDKQENLFVVSAIGGVGSFTDTIGVGSFAVTVALLNATDSVKNIKKLPGTLNIGLVIPNLFAGSLFVSAIEVELATLISLIGAAMLGAFVGAKLVNKVNKAFVAILVSFCLAIAGILMMLAQFKVIGNVENSKDLPSGLHGWKIYVGAISFFVIGGLQSFGIGLYAPALAVISLLGMNVVAAFPIMTCAAGFSMPTTAWTFHKNNDYCPKVSYGLMIGGVIGTLIAFCTVFVGIQGGAGIEMSTFTWYLKWFAIIVMFYASTMLMLKFIKLIKENDKEKPVEKTYKNFFEEQDSMKKIEDELKDISMIKDINLESIEKSLQSNQIKLHKWN